jgi:hypothetical protein
MSIGLTMNKFYTAYAFIEPAASPFVKGSILSLTAQAGTVNTPTSYRVLAGPDGEMITTGPIHAYGYIGSNYTAANLNAADVQFSEDRDQHSIWRLHGPSGRQSDRPST